MQVINTATLFHNETFTLVKEADHAFTVKQVGDDEIIFEQTVTTESEAQLIFYNRMISFAACFAYETELTEQEFANRALSVTTDAALA